MISGHDAGVPSPSESCSCRIEWRKSSKHRMVTEAAKQKYLTLGNMIII